MLVPRDTNSIALSSLIGTPYNYWGDDDGDGQGIDGITATGSLKLSIVDKNYNSVARNKVLTICDNDRAPYRLTLSNTEGTLTTRYGVPNESRFSAGNATYYINPKASPAVCFAKPNVDHINRGLSAAVWDRNKGFLTQSVTPSSYGLNFPTTGANKLFFDLLITGTNQALSWATVSHGGITATMTNSTSTSVRVTLTGPVATESQWYSDNPDRIGRPSLPQVFELVGRDRSGNAVVKYGFELKQWFVNRGYRFSYRYIYSNTKSWCNKIGEYRLPKAKELTNARCDFNGPFGCYNNVEVVVGTSSSPDNYMRRHIGAGFFPEWDTDDGDDDEYTSSSYPESNFSAKSYWADNDSSNDNRYFVWVDPDEGRIKEVFKSFDSNWSLSGLCVYP